MFCIKIWLKVRKFFMILEICWNAAIVFWWVIYFFIFGKKRLFKERFTVVVIIVVIVCCMLVLFIVYYLICIWVNWFFIGIIKFSIYWFEIMIVEWVFFFYYVSYIFKWRVIFKVIKMVYMLILVFSFCVLFSKNNLVK